MRNAIVVLFSLLLSALLSAQTPPTGTHAQVGARNQLQPYASLGSCLKAGEQFIEARVAPGDESTSVFIGNLGPKIGRVLWWVTSAVAVVPAAPAAPVWHAAGATPATVIAVFTGPLTNVPLPFGATGWNISFAPAGAILLSPITAVQTTAASCTTVPAGGFDRQWVSWAIPNDPALIGQVVGAQAARIEPLNGLWYLSNEWITQIAP